MPNSNSYNIPFPKKYDDWWQSWLEGQAQQPPMSSKQMLPFVPPRGPNEVPSYYLKPEDIQRYAQAWNPSELFREGKAHWAMQEPTNYPTMAYNMENANLFASEKGDPRFTLGSTLKDQVPSYNDIPQNKKKYIAQAVQAHEQRHATDPRWNTAKMWSTPNEGYMTKDRLSGPLLQREFPAMRAEDRFWYEKRNDRP